MEFPTDAIIAITSTAIGTILGFGLNFLSECFGRVHIDIDGVQLGISEQNKHDITTDENTGDIIDAVCVGKEVCFLRLSFFLIVYNGKRRTVGIYDCGFYIMSKKGNVKVPLGTLGIFGEDKSDIDDSDELLNIMEKTAKKIRISKRPLYIPDDIQDGFKLYIRYKTNGKNKVYHKKIYECDCVKE